MAEGDNTYDYPRTAAGRLRPAPPATTPPAGPAGGGAGGGGHDRVGPAPVG